MNRNLLIYNAGVLISYVFFWVLNIIIDFSFPFYIFGLLVIYNLCNNLGILFFNRIRKGFVFNFFISLTVFYFLVAPVYYFVYQIYALDLVLFIIIFNVLSIFLVSFFIKKSEIVIPSISKRWILKKIGEYRYLLIMVSIYLLIHFVFYYYYVFIPEWDSYGNLKSIEDVFAGLALIPNYRPLFTVSNLIITKMSLIAPYNLFIYFYIPMQATLLLSLDYLIKRVKGCVSFFDFVLMTLTLSIPVFNMEIDFFRPQSMLIIFLPIYVVFVYEYFKSRNPQYFLLLLLMGIFGTFYHELFVFVVTVSFVTGFFMMKNFVIFWLRKDKKNKYLAMMLFLWVITVFYMFFDKSYQLRYYQSFLGGVLKTLFDKFTNISNWRWWWIGNYSTDGYPMGWIGIKGAIMYYAYYFGPGLLFVVSCLVRFKKQYLGTKSFLMYKIFLLVLFLMLILTELLPRFGFFLLPERLLVFGNLIILMLVILIFSTFTNIGQKLKIMMIVGIFVFSVVGLTGSVYIASSKGSSITRDEYEFSKWILDNTPNNSKIVSQAANWPMVVYFGKRSIIVPEREYFFDNSIEEFGGKTVVTFDETRRSLDDNLRASLNNFDYKTGNIDDLYALLNKYYSQVKEAESKQPLSNGTPEYVLYSKQKFGNLYSKLRPWWREANFYGADLSRFNNKHFKLVYEKNGIYLWEKQ